MKGKPTSGTIRHRSYRLGWQLAVSLCVFGIGLTGCGATSAPSIQPATTDSSERANASLLALADRHAAAILRTSPEWATQIGVPEAIGGQNYTARLSDYGPKGRARDLKLQQRLLAELEQIDRAALSGNAAVTYDVMRYAYEQAAAWNRLQLGLPSVLGFNSPYVINQLFGPHRQIPRMLIGQHAIANATDVEHFLSRLEQLDDVLDQIREKLREDSGQGIVPPAFALEGVARSSTAFTSAEPAAHPIVAALTKKLQALNELAPAQVQKAIGRATIVLAEQTYPAYQRLADTAKALLPDAGEDAGIWRLPQGETVYQLALNAFGASGRSAEEIHQLGLADVARIHREMDSILSDLGYESGSVTQRLEQLAARDGMVLPDTDRAREQILERMNGYIQSVLEIAPQWFATLPARAVTVERIPVYEQDASSGAYYLPPSLDGQRAGAIMMNLKSMGDWPLYTLRTLAHHEGVPGHHFESSMQQSLTDLPLIRKMLFFSEYSEGWALYTEALTKEMGLYDDDPLGDLGRLRAEVFRAARLVVDTGLHYKRWSRQEAIDWMVKATGWSEEWVRREIERYAVWPGQATSYKLGMMKFQALRARAEQQLGSGFNVRAFHDALLRDGSVPMPVLESRIEAWIQSKLY